MSARPGWLLALDASTMWTPIALGRLDADAIDAGFVAGDDGAPDPAQPPSGALVPRIDALLAGAGVPRSALEFVAVGRGPGTFTGTRVALATATGISLGLGCAVVPIATLAMVAAGSGPLEPDADTALVGLLDARRGEVYGAAYRWSRDAGDERLRLVALGPERCTAPDLLRAAIEHDLAGEAAAAVAGATRTTPPQIRWRGPGLEAPGVAAAGIVGADAESAGLVGAPSARGLWRAAASAAIAGVRARPEQLEAVYLRESYAEMGLNVPRRPAYRTPFACD